ncbi:hypothetical protein [Parabacteroides merdae]|uniref:hypothetical protein n=1 Tax=Parabacteroides merdae TaxID=46503 RepID=UPI001898236D|nr:hypothetical protein [Parabacteroides merdae]MDB8935016.1 hypothetical protein [Parabacteroides merdae]MDB8937697.1 hypothetical protein [Parabacteroides merdae]MDB8942551.1 hypothetical protein [Parabacteroides merdae]MDB8946240.1 hypothetical protein [Parabacteroides merdae]MDB8949929.1 hypothetical protein [Parabacteroides merdae]
MKRSIITTDGNGNITMPTDMSITAMSEWELCDLFGVTAPTFRAGLKALCKNGVLMEYGIRRSIRVSDNCSMEVYNLEAIVALAFHIGTFGAEQVRNAVLERLYLRKEKVCYLLSLVNSSNDM